MSTINSKNKNQSEKDFSGLDFVGKVFENIDFHESVFNGAYFTDTKFLNCNLKHTEFTESKFINCSFINSNLDYSDFVYTQISKVIFEQCSFSHIEWRENTFVNIEFRECSFNNSTISLCSFTETSFDSTSSNSFCGASKRYNVFSKTSFPLSEDKVGFLANNYGLILDNYNTTFILNKENKKDFLLLLSSMRYSNHINTEKFIDIVLKAVNSLARSNQKSRIQKVKYLTLICKLTIAENTISIFGQQFLINSLNISSKQIKDPHIFMEMIDLIMFLKTTQYKSIQLIESKISKHKNELSDKITLQLELFNSYKKGQVEGYLNQMATFSNIPNHSFQITKFKKGSTIVDIIIRHSVDVGTLLLFLSFSLSQVSKVLSYLVKIKKSGKELLNKGKKENRREAALMPISILSNEGNVYYVQINNTVNNFGKDAIKIDGPGTVNIIVDNSRNAKN